MHPYIKKIAPALFFCGLAVVNFIVFGLRHARSWKDAAEYSGYGSNFLQHGFYTLDATHFTIYREPGYPFFLSLIYAYFGNENLFAVACIQALFLGIIGFVIYRLFAREGEKTIGIIAGASISALPLYGYYTNEILTEIVFALLLTSIFFVVVQIAQRRIDSMAWYVLLGLLFGYIALVRVQTIFFLPFLILCYFIFFRGTALRAWRQIAITFGICVLVIASWMTYVHANTGVFAITAGRQEEVLNIRATRAALSYGELTQYAYEWIWRSVSGGQSGPILSNYEWKPINRQYYALATTSAAVHAIRAQNIHTILTHPGQYLYGNLIELMKLLYIEHDYTESTSRYFRAAQYILIYAFCWFGIYQFFRAHGQRDLKTIAITAALFVLYNYLFVTMFDVVPRFNTPYLLFYLVIGFVGLVLWKRRRMESIRVRDRSKK